MMRNNIKLVMLTLCTGLAFSSCEKAILTEDEDTPSERDYKDGSAQLTVTTRSGGANETAVAEGRIYIFNNEGTCVQMLSTDDENTSAQVKLAAGTYQLYSVGGDDLARFTLPTMDDATTSSVIGRQTGKVMDEFLWKQTEVTLEDGDNRNLNITLDRKVLCIDEVKITDVPAEVTKVEVALSSFYTTIRLNGTFPDTPTETYKIALTKQADGTTWKAEPQQLLFPSKGAPTITVSLTTGTDLMAFSYTASSAMLANHHYTVAAAYDYAQGGNLACTLTATDWDDDQSITFDLNNDSHVVYNPVAGSFCYGYYVVSVDAENRTAVLLNKNTVAYTAPAAGSDATQAEWIAAVTAPLTSVERPIGISTGSWRLPTLAEVSIFSKDANVATFKDDGTTGSYFCMDGETIKWAYCKRTGDNYEVKSGTAKMSSIVNLRPVIDINY